MKEKIKVIRMVCGMLRKKNTGIILCRGSKNVLFLANGKSEDIAVEIAKVMGENESIREVFASGVLVRILADGSVPALNESGLLDLKKNLGKDYCGRRREMKQFDIEKAKNGAAVCLRDGTPVKILDFDYNGMVLFKYISEQEAPDGKKEERLGWATINGYGRGRHGTCPDKDQDLFMTPVYCYMNVYKNETNKVLVGGVVRATLEECVGAGKDAPMENLKWFCVPRVELLYEGEGGGEC